MERRLYIFDSNNITIISFFHVLHIVASDAYNKFGSAQCPAERQCRLMQHNEQYALIG